MISDLKADSRRWADEQAQAQADPRISSKGNDRLFVSFCAARARAAERRSRDDDARDFCLIVAFSSGISGLQNAHVPPAPRPVGAASRSHG